MTGCPAKVSLIVPVYNVEKYLGKCLESCRNQTLNDLEIICVDDGSTDSSGRILDEFAAEDSRVMVIHKENGGLSSARNAGLKVANGEWIMFLDSDDFLEPNACERVWVESQEEETEIIVFGSDFFPKHPAPKDEHWLRSVLYTWTQRFTDFEPYVLFHMPGAKPFVWRQAFSSMLLKEHELEFDETAKFAEDIIFQFMAFPHAKRISFIADSLYHYRVGRKGSLMQNIEKKLSEKAAWHINVVDRLAAYWNSNGFLEKYGTEFLEWVMEYIAEDLISKPIENKKELTENLLQSLELHGVTEYSKEMPLEKRAVWNKLQKLL